VTMDDLCLVCGQTRRWHMEHNPHHEFSSTSSTPQVPEQTKIKDPSSPVGLRGDVVLRLTLLRKGLVSEAELEETRFLVERAAEMGRALVLEPEQGSLTGWRFNLVTQEELVKRMLEKPNAPAPI